MVNGWSQPRIRILPHMPGIRAQLLCVLLGTLLALLLVELLPCAGAACSEAGRTDTGRQLESITATAPSLPVPPSPVSLPEMSTHCALHYLHCSFLLDHVLVFGAILIPVMMLSAGPLLALPMWTVAPPLPPP